MLEAISLSIVCMYVFSMYVFSMYVLLCCTIVLFCVVPLATAVPPAAISTTALDVEVESRLELASMTCASNTSCWPLSNKSKVGNTHSTTLFRTDRLGFHHTRFSPPLFGVLFEVEPRGSGELACFSKRLDLQDTSARDEE